MQFLEYKTLFDDYYKGSFFKVGILSCRKIKISMVNLEPDGGTSQNMC